MGTSSRVFSLFLVLMVPGVILDTLQDGNKLLLIVLGGVRWDSDEMVGLHHLAAKGVKAAYLEPVFPAMTIPNLYTIMTGLYPASHGQTGDYMYDAEKNLSFNKMANYRIDSDPLWWQKGDPFWVNVMRQKKRAYLYRWPGCDVYIRGIKPTFCRPVSDWLMSVDELRNNLNESLRVLSNDSADFVGVYYNGLEQVSYNYGHSAHLNEAMMNVDDIISNLQHVMEKTSVPGDVTRRLSDIINIMVVSDHGFTRISPTRVINMMSRLNSWPIRHVISDRSLLQIWPDHDAIEMVFSALNTSHSNYTAYSIGHMPDSWHYMRGPFVAPIILLADVGYTFLAPKSPKFPTYTHGGQVKPRAAGSGYSNTLQDMRGIFYARGPHFKPGARPEGFSCVHLYQVMCAILGVDMSSNDGSWSAVSAMLVSTHIPHQYSYHSHRNNFVTALIVLTLLFCIISGACALWCRRESIKKWYQYRSIRWEPLHDGVI